MTEKCKYNNYYICGIEISVIQDAFEKYKQDTADGVVGLPSLPHFLSGLPEYLGEDDLKRYLQEYGEGRGAHKIGVTTICRILQWFRGQYLSNPAWSGHQSQKAMIALQQNFGDGVSFNPKGERKQGPDVLKVQFGTDEESKTAGR